MNSVIRLALHVDPKTMKLPLQNMPEMLDTDQFALSFADVFATIDDGESEASIPDIVNIEGDDQQPLQLDGAAILPVPKAEYGIGEWSQPLEKAVEDEPFPEDEKQPVELLQHHAIMRDVQTEPMPVDNLKKAKLTIEALEQSTPKQPTPEQLMVRSEGLPDKENAAQHIENVTPKEKPIFVGAGLTRPADKLPEPKTASTEDSAPSPVRPVVQVNPVPLTAPPVNSMVIPAMPTAVPHMVSVAAATAAAVPVLNMEMDDQWVATLSRDIGQLSADKSTLSFQLKPNHLGKLHVEISTDVTGDIVRLETDNEHAKALIIGSQGRLEQDIRLSGIKLARVDVALHEQSGSQFDGRGSGSQENGSELGRDHEARSQAHMVQQILSAENETVASPPDHGARYA